MKCLKPLTFQFPLTVQSFSEIRFESVNLNRRDIIWGLSGSAMFLSLLGSKSHLSYMFSSIIFSFYKCQCNTNVTGLFYICDVQFMHIYIPKDTFISIAVC